MMNPHGELREMMIDVMIDAPTANFILLRTYNDGTTHAEPVDAIEQALYAASIYLFDNDCRTVKIWDLKHSGLIMNYERRV